MEKVRLNTYAIKVRIYPNLDQKSKIDQILSAIESAYNLTMTAVFNMDDRVIRHNAEGDMSWPDFFKMANARWRKTLIKKDPYIALVPASTLCTNAGIFLSDAKKAWTTGMHSLPIERAKKDDFHFYSESRTRTSFYVQVLPSTIIPSSANPKVVSIKIPHIGRVKGRGFKSDLYFGMTGELSFPEAAKKGCLQNYVGLTVSKDSCGDYYATIRLSDGRDHSKAIFKDVDIKERGDVGIFLSSGKNLMALSDGTVIPGRAFKGEERKSLKAMQDRLSGMKGPLNPAFRALPNGIKGENYIKTAVKKASLEKKVKRRRDAYYHELSDHICRNYKLIAMKEISLRDSLRNRSTSAQTYDAALASLVNKIKYKARDYGCDLRILPMKTNIKYCASCKLRLPEQFVFGEYWECPNCGKIQDRELNFAKNILEMAKFSPSEQNAEESPKNHEPRVYPVTAVSQNVGIIRSFELSSGRADNRYVVIDTDTGEVLDDANGSGYKTVSNARKGFLGKREKN